MRMTVLELSKRPNAKARGVSLIEMGMVIVFISLALAPIIRMVGGPQNDSGNAFRVTGLKSKEAILANTMVDKVLAHDYGSFDCDGSGSANNGFDPNAGLPVGTNQANSIKVYNLCKAQNTSSELYYQWTVVNLNSSNNTADMPSKNRYYQATFKVMGPDKNTNNPLLVMPINFFYNEGGTTTKAENTGVEIAMDRSGSMASSVSGLPSIWGTASPYLFYRYKAFPTGMNEWGFTFPNNPDKVVLDPNDNSQLDLSYAKQVKWPGPGPSPYKDGEDPDPTTPFNEAFPFAKANPSIPGQNVWGDGVLGSGDCSSPSNNDWTNVGSGDKNLFYTFLPEARANLGTRSMLTALCSEKNDMSVDPTKHWSYVVNHYMSRFEAARTATLSLLLKLEEQPAVANSIELGYFPWGSYPAAEHEVKMEKVANGRFVNNRKKMLWINRVDPANRNDNGNSIKLEGGTQIHDGLEYARQRLLQGKYDRRILVLLTDGEPNPNAGTNSNAPYGGNGLRDYTKKYLGCGVSDPKQRVTLFTVGLIQADKQLLADMADSTPSGQSFYASDIASLTPIFETVSYQIQKLALLSTASRYGFSFSEEDSCN